MTILVIVLASIAIGASTLAIAYRYQLRRRPFRVAGPNGVEQIPPTVRQHDSRFKVVTSDGIELYRGPHGVEARKIFENTVPLPMRTVTITDYGKWRGEKTG